MARLAILSDLHSDARALEDALRSIEEMGIERVVCAGDLVDYGTDPERTLGILRERKIPTIRGNHDRWAVGSPGSLDRAERSLSPPSLRFLQELPSALDEVIEGVRVAIRHGNPSSDMRGIYPRLTGREELVGYLEEVGSDVLVVGHTHIPCILALENRAVVNPGALLRDPSSKMAGKRLLFDVAARSFVTEPGPTAGGTFGVLELPSRRFSVHAARGGEEVRPVRLEL